MPLVNKPGAKGILYLAFNQDSSCIAIARSDGIKIYSLEAHTICFDYPIGAVSVAEMLFCTSLLAYSGAGEQPNLTPRRLRIMNTSTQSPIRDLNFPSTVLAIRMNRKRLIVVLENRCYVHHLDTLEILRVLETPSNPRGLVAVSPSSESCLLALPGSQTAGKIHIHDMLVEGGNVLSEITAHKSPLETMVFNRDGTMLASASSKGTVIRVYSMPHARLLFSFRRGTYAATIYSLAFSPPGQEPELLCAASSHGSVHIFHLKENERHPAAAAATSLMSSMMPKSISDMVEPPRSLGTVKLPVADIPAACSLHAVHEEDSHDVGNPSTWVQGPGNLRQRPKVKLTVATLHGILYEYHLTVVLDHEQDSMLEYALEREGRLF
mmetsp:Transcript_11350/g.32228  ORF Transcript_11350/g.32228 Transcript_11350/m.32228 type:complete len:380 (+) Transcript_11350:149-1288(+)